MEVTKLMIETEKGRVVFRPGTRFKIQFGTDALCAYDPETNMNYHYPWTNLVSYQFKVYKEESGSDKEDRDGSDI